MITNQLTLGVGLKDDATFLNYYSAENEQLVIELKKSASGKGESIIYFYGAGGEGRTHLLQAVCHEAERHQLTSVYLPLNYTKDLSPEIFEGLESLSVIAIDDLHHIMGQREWEEAFFHFYNRVRDTGAHLVLSGNTIPKALGAVLPDVISRLEWGMVFQLHPLTDEEKRQVMIMRAECRGMILSDDVSRFIFTHCPRHMSTLFAALEALDKASLAAQRKLTVPFVKQILQI